MEEEKKEDQEEVAVRKWLSDDPLCTSYVAAQAGYIQDEATTYMGGLIRVRDGSVFDVGFELFDGGGGHYDDSYKIYTDEDLATVRMAIKRVRETLDFLEKKIDDEFPRFEESDSDDDGKSEEPTPGEPSAADGTTPEGS